jgi:hypothetical protein
VESSIFVEPPLLFFTTARSRKTLASSSRTAGSSSTGQGGGVANDTLEAVGADTTLNGGTANELFVVGNATVVVVGSGIGADTLNSSVSYTLPTLVDTLTFTGTSNLSATGNSDSANLITANSGSDTLIARSGAVPGRTPWYPERASIPCAVEPAPATGK